MAGWDDDWWESRIDSGLPRSARRSGPFRSYLPDRLGDLALVLPAGVSARAGVVERRLRRLVEDGETVGLAGISRFLLRSEAIASSRIEGIAPSAQQVALAELSGQERVRGLSDQAREVANNITALRLASADLATDDEVTLDAIVRLHRALLPNDSMGIRPVQNWIGGSSWHPLDADFVPPSPTRLAALLADLVSYVNGAAHSAIVQAALVHAQFETIHPFADGNGRVGRALIHTVLARRGLTPGSILPVSLVLSTLRERYVAGLSGYRYTGPQDSAEARAGVIGWISLFLDAAALAIDQARTLAQDLARIRAGGIEALAAARAAAGRRPDPRSDSATVTLLERLPELPLLTARSASLALGISAQAARSALEELAGAGVMTRRVLDRNVTGYFATEIFELVTSTERRLASTQFDTRLSPPNRAVAARGQA